MTSALPDTTAMVTKLKAALEPFAGIKADDGDDFSDYPDEVVIRCEVTAGELNAAREALDSLPALLSALETAHDEAIEKAAAIADRMIGFADRDTPKAQGSRWAAETIAKAIRALKVHPNAD